MTSVIGAEQQLQVYNKTFDMRMAGYDASLPTRKHPRVMVIGRWKIARICWQRTAERRDDHESSARDLGRQRVSNTQRYLRCS